MYTQTSPYTYSIQSSNTVQAMHPPLSSSTTTTTTAASNNNTIRLSHEHRTRLYLVISELTDDQLRLFLTNHLQSISNQTLTNQFQHHSRTQLIQQAYILIDSNYSVDLEQTIYALRQKRFTLDYQQQQQQQMYRPQQQQQQQHYNTSFNQQAYYYTPQTGQYNVQPNYRFPTPTNVSSQYRQIRPNANPTQSANQHRPSQPQPQQQQRSSYLVSVVPHQQYVPPSIPTTPSSTSIARYQIPVLPPPPSTNTRVTLPTKLNIIHKTLPFYQPLTCVYESQQVFRFDNYRKQYFSRNDFLLSYDVCNQLALSYDYDSDLDIHKTSKCLIMRLVRIDQPPMSNGKYDDSLPPNIVIHINSQNLTNLPAPKACTRQQTDLIRIGREIDITSYCMFNPVLNNELAMTWSYRQDNTNLHLQYMNAQYALHIFLVQHLTIEDLCEQIKNKAIKFYREDLVKLVAKAIETDRDLGLEVSDQILKLKCPIDQRRLKIPIRAITCQHLQCFDLTNYIALNEKSGKWICPVCNKTALFDDLQIDSYTESIIHSIENENIIEITIDSHLNWTPVTSSLMIEQQQQQHHHQQQITSNMDDIILDDDDDDDQQMNNQHQDMDSKLNIPLISTTTTTNQPKDVILLDD